MEQGALSGSAGRRSTAGLAVATSIQEMSETTWRVEIFNLRSDGPARGTLYLVCPR